MAEAIAIDPELEQFAVNPWRPHPHKWPAS